MGDKSTDLIGRERLAGLVLATERSGLHHDVHPHTIHRGRGPRVSLPAGPAPDAAPEPSASPLVVLVVVGMLVALFVAIIRL